MARQPKMGVLAAAFLVWLSLGSAPVASAEARYSIPLGDSPSIGPQNAPVVLVEFLDYQ